MSDKTFLKENKKSAEEILKKKLRKQTIYVSSFKGSTKGSGKKTTGKRSQSPSVWNDTILKKSIQKLPGLQSMGSKRIGHNWVMMTTINIGESKVFVQKHNVSISREQYCSFYNNKYKKLFYSIKIHVETILGWCVRGDCVN